MKVFPEAVFIIATRGKMYLEVVGACCCSAHFATLRCICVNRTYEAHRQSFPASRYGSPRVKEFERIFNREMWWVATEVCSEKNVQKRAKLIKNYIKVARHCRELRNFNSMFVIKSGLDKPVVRRLHSTWERISGKYVRMLEDVRQLVDPSRNMSKYRQHLTEVAQEPPVVPIYPPIKKDLTLSHEGKYIYCPTYCEKLVNFEKLQLIAKPARAVSKLSSAPYEISSMAERSGGTISDALLHMNTFGIWNVATMRKGGQVVQPRKKVYEQALMVWKVKAYLDGLGVVGIESELDRLSYDIEPQQYGPLIRRVPSPSPSSISSQSAEYNSLDHRRFKGGGMLGVYSPQAVQKMLGLVQTSKSKGVPSSPSQSPALSTRSRGLQRNLPRVSARQQSVPTLQRAPSFKQEPVDLHKESSSVTTFYGADMSQPKKQRLERKVPVFTEEETKTLISLYLKNRDEFHGKFKSGGKTGESARQILLNEWALEISSLGVAKRTKENVEEKIKNEIKKVQKHLKLEKEKYSGTGGGVFALPTLPTYLIPLAEVLSEKHHIVGVPEIDDFDDDEQMNGEAAEEKDLTTIVDLDVQHTHTPSSSQRKSLSASARETLSLFTDKRSMLYEEEIKVAQLKQQKLRLEIELAEVRLEEARTALAKTKAIGSSGPSVQVPYYFAGHGDSHSPIV